MLSEKILGEAYRIRGKNLARCRDMLRLVLPEIEKALEELRKESNRPPELKTRRPWLTRDDNIRPASRDCV